MRIFAAILTLLVVSSTLASAVAFKDAPAGEVSEEHDFLPMAMLAELYADEFPLEPQPEGLDAVQATNYWLNERVIQGRTPADWIATSKASFTLDPVTAAPAAPDADLVAAVLRLYAAYGVTVTPLDAAAITTAAAGVPDDVRGAFAELVDATAATYERQVPLAAKVLARWPAEFDRHNPLVTHEERDAMTQNAADWLLAMKTFQARTNGLFTPTTGTSGPLFADPLGLVYLGGTGDDTYTRGVLIKDPILIVDPAGDDTYLTSAGGACPDPVHLAHRCNGLAAAAVFDLGGDDTYTYDGEPAAVQGAGSIGGLGLLVDTTGADEYFTKFTRTNRGPFYQYIDGGAQGFAQGGFGAMIDGTGDDTYTLQVYSSQGRSIWGFGQGFGSAGSLGLAVDGEGDDRWLNDGLGIEGGGFEGLYTMGSGFYAGVGLILEMGGGNDEYRAFLEGRTTDYYAQGFGAFAGLGIQLDDGGDDSWYAVEVASNPWINPLLNCAFGTASIGGVGIFLEMGGDDTYYGDTVSPRRSATMNEGFGGIGAAYGLHVDVSGNDRHEMYATGAPGSFVAGRGVALQGGNIIGNYLDAGGDDVYVGPGSDGATWVGGADINVMPSGIF